MDRLLPCPFCGGEARIEHDHDSANLKERWNIWHECCEYEGESAGYGNALFPWYETPWYYTEAEAIAAWNTRAERTCFADEVTHRDCKYSVNRGWRERTCHIEYPYYGDAPVINGQPRCSECKTEFAVGTFPNYCPYCGAKVVD